VLDVWSTKIKQPLVQRMWMRGGRKREDKT
jgi:hypothetical protein